jgi:hypothetical protein
MVVSSVTREDYSLDLEITAQKVVHGDPPIVPRVNAMAGYPCEQTADAGERIVILFDTRRVPDEPVLPGSYTRLPLYYVVDGPDELHLAVVQEAFGALPATDAWIVGSEPGGGAPTAVSPGTDGHFTRPASPPAVSMLIAGFAMLGGLLWFRRMRST